MSTIIKFLAIYPSSMFEFFEHLDKKRMPALMYAWFKIAAAGETTLLARIC